MHYVLKDHQGSLTGLANASGQLSERYSYDAFGRRRNAQNWSYDNITTGSITDRGYTFHEHLDEFGLINMNGRVYDPLVGQMLSPDPFIQQPEYSQSYNRYGYVFNNPLRFTDPSGYFASGDTTGKQQGNAESIFIRKEREDQQKERLSYNTDESTDGPGVNQLQVEGENGGSDELLYPVDAKYPISSGYTENNRTIAELNQSRPHRAIDIATPFGTAIISPDGGTITVAKEFSYGKAIIIKHDYTFNGQALSTSYSHLSQMLVNAGDPVIRGQIIGYTGTYGTGPHLHFVVRLDDKKVNPVIVFPLYK